ncbi:MAG: TonB family protein [Terracidiphilus sp.]
MPAQILIAICFVGALSGLAQEATAPQPGQIKDPRAILAAAAPFYDFSDPTLKPWHLKASYQLYDDKGNPSEQGTFEYWWVSPKVYRSTWSRPSASHTHWQTAGGTEAYVETGERLRYFEENLSSDLFSPLPTAAEIDPTKIRLLRNKIKLVGENLVCVSEKPTKGEEPSDFRVLPTECFDAVLPVERFSLDSQGVVATAYDNVVSFQGKFLTHSVQITVGKQKLFSASVDSVGVLDASDPALIPPQDATFKPDAVQSKGRVDIGSLMKTKPLDFPAFAREQGVQGTVVVDVVVGADGTIKDPHVIYSPSPLLSTSTLEALSHWEYKPYLLDGKPIEVDIIIAMTFSLGSKTELLF